MSISSVSSNNENQNQQTPKPWQSYHTVFTNAKAGMEGVDKEKVQRIVYEMSKGSKYFENEQRKEALIKQKIEQMRAKYSKLSPSDIARYQKVAERRITELEATRDLSRIWLHVDMDAFYAAVETLSNPSLKGKPMAVGGMSMISTANYEARKYGVRAAMPGFIARKLCPKLIFVPTDFEKYTYYSSLTREVHRRYDPNFIAASLDEAYLDITKVCQERGISGDEVAEELRNGVFEETGLTCSAGVAPNRLLAKVCSDINKPNGQFVLPNDRLAVMTFISSLPIRKIGGIGKVMEHILRDVFGINTCEEMLLKGGYLCALFSQSSAEFILSVGLGLGSTDTPLVRMRKSMSNERTFSATADEKFLYQKLAEIAEMLASDLQKEALRGRTLTLKLKTASFEVRTRAVTLQKYILSTEDILSHAKKLLKAELPSSLRLLGLRVSHFSEEKAGPSDPTQKSITNFVISGSTARSNLCGNDCSVDNGFGIDSEVGFMVSDLSMDCVHNDVFSSDQLSDSANSDCCTDGIALVSNKKKELPNNLYVEVSAPVVVGTVSSSDSDACDVLGTTISHLNVTNVDEASICTNHQDYDAVPSTCPPDQLQWVDNYKCSICGSELPPEFSVERQEHADFHFAERLQEECSSDRSMNRQLRQRHFNRDQKLSQSRNKRRKSLPEQGKYLSIDKFFSKKTETS